MQNSDLSAGTITFSIPHFVRARNYVLRHSRRVKWLTATADWGNFATLESWRFSLPLLPINHTIA